MQKSAKILVIQTAFIGDVILSTSLAENIKQNHPDYEIHYVVRSGNESLFDDHPFISKVWCWEKSKHKFRSLIELIVSIRKEKYKKVIVLQRFFNAGLMAGLSKGKEIIGFRKNPVSFLFHRKIAHRYQANLHEVDRNNALISHFCTNLKRRPVLYPSDFSPREIHENYYTCSPASVWYTKQFPKEKWLQLINETPKEMQVILLGGPKDAQLCDAILSPSINRNVINLAGKVTLLESAAIMKKAKMNFVNDSAPMHLASSVNAPVTAIFCSTVPEFGFGPLSENSYVAQTAENLSCRPCGLHGHEKCPKGHFKCALNIETKSLMKGIRSNK